MITGDSTTQGNARTPQPVVGITLVRETHVSDLVGNAKTEDNGEFYLHDGLGRQIQQRCKAEPESSRSDAIQS